MFLSRIQVFTDRELIVSMKESGLVELFFFGNITHLYFCSYNSFSHLHDFFSIELKQLWLTCNISRLVETPTVKAI